MVPVDRCNQTNPHTNTNVHQIRATISPLPEHLAHRANMVQHGQHNAEFLRTLCDDHQRQREVEVEEVDPTEIMTQIMASGILNWNSQESLAATQRPDESVNNSHDIEAWESDVENDKSIDHPKDKRPRRPRGRPARRAKSESQSIVASVWIHI